MKKNYAQTILERLKKQRQEKGMNYAFFTGVNIDDIINIIELDERAILNYKDDIDCLKSRIEELESIVKYIPDFQP